MPAIPPIGAAEFEMQIVSPVGRRTYSWGSQLSENARTVADLVMARG